MGMVILTSANGQGILKKLKNKAEREIDKSINGSNPNSGNTNNGTTGPGNSGASSGSATNTSGQGLISKPPDINENLATAETSFKNKNYSDARFSVQQAMLGVELMIGQQILKSMPVAVSNLPKDTTYDQVASTGWGWAGLTIQRVYKEKDVEFKVTIANNAVWMQAVNLYFTNGGYMQASGDQQKWKMTRVKGYKAIIEFDKSSGYKLSIPLGQTSLIVMEGVNFNTEQQMMDAANAIDIDGIKKALGEK
jgi:hypothetical protein